MWPITRRVTGSIWCRSVQFRSDRRLLVWTLPVEYTCPELEFSSFKFSSVQSVCCEHGFNDTNVMTHRDRFWTTLIYTHFRKTLSVWIMLRYLNLGWLGSRVVSVLDSGAEGPGFKSQPRRCRVTVLGSHPLCLCSPNSKIGSSPLKGARVSTGLAESNGSLPPGLWLTPPASWLPRTGISSGTLRSAIEYMGYLYHFISILD